LRKSSKIVFIAFNPSFIMTNPKRIPATQNNFWFSKLKKWNASF
jgi:hypothetical protein